MEKLKRETNILEERIQAIRPEIAKRALSVQDPSIDSIAPSVLPDIQTYFPHLFHSYTHPVLIEKKTTYKVAVVFSGGPASGGNNVIAALFDFLQEVSGDNGELIGFLGGPKGLLENKWIVLNKAEVDPIRNMGGFDLLVSGRTKIESESDLVKVLETIRYHNLDGLVIIGGDDSNTNAAYIAEKILREKIPCTVVGVPKTIDGDIQSEHIPISFGFDTATKVYSNLIGNVARDCLSTKKYCFFIRLMGRSASHITLECALQTRPNYVAISEEISKKQQTLQDVVAEITDIVLQRIQNNKPYGIFLIPEGLIESMSDVKLLIQEMNQLFSSHTLQLQKIKTARKRLVYILQHLSNQSHETLASFPPQIELQLVEERDPHGNVQVSKIETERLLASLVHDRIQKINPKALEKYVPQCSFYGYEGRSAYPTPFDATYCYNLGRVAGFLIIQHKQGQIACLQNLKKPVSEWIPTAVPLLNLMHFEMRSEVFRPVVRKTIVNLDSPLFQAFMQKREEWKMEDCYQFLPPTQFFGTMDSGLEPCLYISLHT